MKPWRVLSGTSLLAHLRRRTYSLGSLIFTMSVLLMLCGMSLAQTNTLELRGEVSMLEPGKSFTLDAVVTQAVPNAQTTSLQAHLLFDPRYFEVTFKPADIMGVRISVVQNETRTFKVTVGPFAGERTARFVSLAFSHAMTGMGGAKLPAKTVVGTYTLTLKRTPPQNTTFGWTNAVITKPELPEDVRCVVVTHPTAATAFKNGVLHFGPVSEEDKPAQKEPEKPKSDGWK